MVKSIANPWPFPGLLWPRHHTAGMHWGSHHDICAALRLLEWFLFMSPFISCFLWMVFIGFLEFIQAVFLGCCPNRYKTHRNLPPFLQRPTSSATTMKSYFLVPRKSRSPWPDTLGNDMSTMGPCGNSNEAGIPKIPSSFSHCFHWTKSSLHQPGDVSVVHFPYLSQY